MLLQDFQPSDALRHLIKCYRIIHFTWGAGEAIPCKVYPPKPEQVLHFFLNNPLVIETGKERRSDLPLVLFTGQQTSMVKQTTGQHFTGVQIVFQPTAVYQLTGVPATETTGCFFDARVFFPAAIEVTLQKMQNAASYRELLSLAEDLAIYLAGQAKKQPLPIDQACQLLVRRHGAASVEWLARESCLSMKQFKRKFEERVGVNPKAYARLLRFIRAYNTKNCFPQKEWSVIATRCNYADYQHLAKDYKQFTGLTPQQFHLHEINSPENVLGLSKALYRSRYFATD